MRVLVTGAGGLVGREVVRAFDGHDVAACDHTRLDITDRQTVLEAVLATRAEIVIHPAAWTSVDACEDDPDRAYAVNGLGTRNLAEAARRAGAHLLYVSTDYVFDGELDRPYVEWDAPRPISVYGHSKLAGELELTPDATIVRTSWVCGDTPGNFVSLVLRLAREQGTLRFVDHERSRPTLVTDLVPVLRRLAVERRPGIHHVTNEGTATRYELAAAILEAAGLDSARVEPVGVDQLDPPRRATRPVNSVLDNAVLRAEGEPPLPDYRESLPALVRSMLP
jgi:dTDP-4-dehydrorhamnose reductase